jgi:hypothetical protein
MMRKTAADFWPDLAQIQTEVHRLTPFGRR